MMLSSTISTLIGGTVPSRRLVGTAEEPLLPTFFFDFRGFCAGRGEDTRGGGVRTDFGVCSGGGAGGVDEPGGGGAEAPLRGGFAESKRQNQMQRQQAHWSTFAQAEAK
jgi:hypothetical protein